MSLDLDVDRLVSLERSAREALPALTDIAAPGWLCRISGGTTKRVNSANPIEPGARIEAVRAIAEDAYAASGLPVRFRLTPLAATECDPLLAAAGYARVDASLTMTATLSPRRGPPDLRLSLRADAAWCAGVTAASGWSGEADRAHRALLDRLPAGSIVATLYDGDEPIAFGAAALGHGRICLFDIVVAAAWRGRGIGRRLVEGLLGWAAAQGHGEALLQVLADNAPARALYASLGFVDAYPYHYRIKAD